MQVLTLSLRELTLTCKTPGCSSNAANSWEKMSLYDFKGSALCSKIAKTHKSCFNLFMSEIRVQENYTLGDLPETLLSQRPSNFTDNMLKIQACIFSKMQSVAHMKVKLMEASVILEVNNGFELFEFSQ